MDHDPGPPGYFKIGVIECAISCLMIFANTLKMWLASLQNGPIVKIVQEKSDKG